MGCGGSKAVWPQVADAGQVLQHVAYIIVDVQNDFVSGSLKVGTDAEAVVGPINQVRQTVNFGMVVHTQDSHPPDHVSFHDNHEGVEVFQSVKIPAPDGDEVDQVMWPRHCVQKSAGWEFHPDLIVADTDFIQAKGTNVAVDSYSGFFDNCKGSTTGLDKVLRKRGITDVFVVGLAFDYCVGLTACDAAALGFNTYVVEDLSRCVADGTANDMRNNLAEHNVKLIKQDEVAELASAGNAKARLVATSKTSSVKARQGQDEKGRLRLSSEPIISVPDALSAGFAAASHKKFLVISEGPDPSPK